MIDVNDSYSKPPLVNEISIDLSSLNTEQALFLSSFLKGKNRTALHLYFKNTLSKIDKETSDVKRNMLIEAHPYLIKLMYIADKYNQRNGHTVDTHCPIIHSRRPIYDGKKVILVKNNKVLVSNRKKGHSYYLDFVDGGRYSGNAEYFAEKYDDIILKASPFLEPK